MSILKCFGIIAFMLAAFSQNLLCQIMLNDSLTEGTYRARHVKGPATGYVDLMIVDSTNIKPDHTYRITFKENMSIDGYLYTDYFTLLDTTENTILYKEERVNDEFNGRPLSYVADGFQFTFQNPLTLTVDEDKSGWNNNDILDFDFGVFRYARTIGYSQPADYQIEFYDVGIDTSTEIEISATRVLPPTPVNFKIKNLTANKYINFGFWERDLIEGEEGQFTAFTDRSRTDEIILLDEINCITWQIRLDDDSYNENRNPYKGDSLKIYLNKPFTSLDVFEMTMTKDFTFVSSDNSASRPCFFLLNKNYPNPFNPTTTITYEIPYTVYVQLSIYDVLGRHVKRLVDEQKSAGQFKISWDATNDTGERVAAGLYFCRMEAEDFVQTRKMMLVR